MTFIDRKLSRRTKPKVTWGKTPHGPQSVAKVRKIMRKPRMRKVARARGGGW